MILQFKKEYDIIITVNDESVDRRSVLDIQLYQIILIAAVTLCAGYVQSVSGFGFGIVAMIFLPRLLMYTEANVLSSILSALISVLVVFETYKNANKNNIVFPFIGNFISTYLAVTFAKSVTHEVLICLLGIALFGLSVYFLFFTDKIKIKPTKAAGFAAGVISGVMGGLFSVSGPPMVIYYMQSEKDSKTYLATLSAYFVLTNISSISMKALAGFVTANVGVALLFALPMVAAGSFLGKRTRTKIDPAMLKKVVYGFMAVSGIVNVVTSVI